MGSTFLLEQGAVVSPNHAGIANLSAALQVELGVADDDTLVYLAREADAQPSVERYIELSLQYYRAGRYQDCLDACRKALAIDPDSAAAYNNMCSAYVHLGRFENAIQACDRALEIAPDYDRAKANLAWAEQSRSDALAERAGLNRR